MTEPTDDDLRKIAEDAQRRTRYHSGLDEALLTKLAQGLLTLHGLVPLKDRPTRLVRFLREAIAANPRKP